MTVGRKTNADEETARIPGWSGLAIQLFFRPADLRERLNTLGLGGDPGLGDVLRRARRGVEDAGKWLASAALLVAVALAVNLLLAALLSRSTLSVHLPSLGVLALFAGIVSVFSGLAHAAAFGVATMTALMLSICVFPTSAGQFDLGMLLFGFAVGAAARIDAVLEEGHGASSTDAGLSIFIIIVYALAREVDSSLISWMGLGFVHAATASAGFVVGRYGWLLLGLACVWMVGLRVRFPRDSRALRRRTSLLPSRGLQPLRDPLPGLVPFLVRAGEVDEDEALASIRVAWESGQRVAATRALDALREETMRRRIQEGRFGGLLLEPVLREMPWETEYPLGWVGELAIETNNALGTIDVDQRQGLVRGVAERLRSTRVTNPDEAKAFRNRFGVELLDLWRDKLAELCPAAFRDDERPRLFLSYRRSDTESAVKQLFQRLGRYLDPGQVFFDRKLEDGVDWETVLRDNLERTSVLLVLIGERWFDANGKASEQVLQEIQRAEQAGARIVPVTVDGAPMPPDFQAAKWQAKKLDSGDEHLAQLLPLLREREFHFRADRDRG